MPPHTISPSPSSQGLGIYQSTLSPPQPHQHTGAQRFTGMVPRQLPPSTSPNRLPRAGPSPGRATASTTAPSPTRGATNTHGQPLFQARPAPARTYSSESQRSQASSSSPPRGQPLLQPAFSLRPTHSRTGSSSKGFASFSALPPSPSVSRPLGPRASPKIGGPASTTTSESDHSVDTAIPAYEDEDTPKQSLVELAVPTVSPSRRGSVASSLTSASTSKMSRRAKSSEMLRKMSRGSDFLGKGSSQPRYQPLSGEDMDEPRSTTVEASPVESLPYPRPPSTHYRGESSNAGASPSKQSNRSLGNSSSDQTNSSFHARSFPFPPSHPPRSSTVSSDPMADRRPSHPPSQGMGRSLSQPLYLYSVPEINSDLGRASGGPRPDSATMAKRSSDFSTGVHSKNAALLSAETGAMMLAFSPTGDGTYRQGEIICGSGTGLIPGPRSPPKSAPVRTASMEDDELRARPWSDSTMSQHLLLSKPKMLGQRGRSLSDGAQLLARQGTLLHPSSSNKRASAELGVLLGGARSRRLSQSKLLPLPDASHPDLSWEKNTKVRLEASKKGKARVEVDVVLERECVVEGGEVRGRMEVRITGGKRGEGLRVGGGKVRVVGFEEISGTSRHIFYHHPHPLAVFDPSIEHNLSSSLFASGPDSDGYRLAAEGTHSIPFRMRLPLGGGAKGTYTTSGGKGPSVRYVVVGSIKLHIPSTGKRSIAHFYRSIVVLPYLNPSVVLAPSPEPVEAYVERGLGWSLTGEKGRVELRVSMGRRIWVSGQRLWCEVGIRNDSSRKIKTLNIALLQTVQAFNPQPLLDTRELPTRLVQKRKSLGNCKGTAAVPDTPDLDACQTSTQMRKVCEEVTEADFASRGAGRVTGRGWWTGVEPGEQGHWDMSIQVPPGMLSIRRTRLLEVQYTLRVTLNGSIYVDLPVQLINFLSIDPPPMPGLGAHLTATMPISQTIEAPGAVGIGADGQPLNTGVHHHKQQQQQQRRSMRAHGQSNSGFSLDSLGVAAKASSTTLHIDALLQAGRARAEAEAQYAELQPLELDAPKPRPISMGSTYTVDKDMLASLQATGPGPQALLQERGVSRTRSTPTMRPKGARFMSYRSAQSDSHSVFSGIEETENVEDEAEDEDDRAMLAARRTQARQRSLAAIHRDLDQEARKLLAEEEAAAAAADHRRGSGGETPPEGQFRPCHTPSEETYKLGGDTPESELQAGNRSRAETPLVPPSEQATHEAHAELEEEHGEGLDQQYDSEHEYRHLNGEEELEHEQEDEDEQEHEYEYEHVGDQTILEDLVGEEREELEEVISLHEYEQDGAHEYDYADEVESDLEDQHQHQHQHQQEEAEMYLDRPTSGRLPFLSAPSRDRDRDRETHIAQSRSINGSLAPSAISGISEQESEVGQVFEAVKRNVSVRLPPRLLPLPHASSGSQACEAEEDPSEDRERKNLSVPRSGSVSHALLAQRRASHASERDRRGSTASLGLKSYTLAPPVVPPPGSTPRRGSQDPSGRRGSSAVKEHSPLRASITEEASPSPPATSKAAESQPQGQAPAPATKGLQKKSSFSFATPGSPLKVKVNIPLANKGESFRRGLSPGLSPKSVHPTAMEMTRGLSGHSANSQLRHEVHPTDLYQQEGQDASPELDAEGSDDDHEEHEHEHEHVPGLAPSIASDSASSEGYNPLYSPLTYDSAPGLHNAAGAANAGSSPPRLPIVPGAKRALPQAPALGMTFTKGLGAYQSQDDMGHPAWTPGGEFLRTQVNFVHDSIAIATARNRPSFSVSVKDTALAESPNVSVHGHDVNGGTSSNGHYERPRPAGTMGQEKTESYDYQYGRRRSTLHPHPPSDDSHSHSHAHPLDGQHSGVPSPMGSPASSCHSILPSVKTKIAQLNSREEALRKFSVSGASVTLPDSAITTPTTTAPTGHTATAAGTSAGAGAGAGGSPASKRRSYTTALAPRPIRSSSDDQFDHPSSHGHGHGSYAQGYDTNMNMSWKHDRSSTHSQPMSAGPSCTGAPAVRGVVGHTTSFPRQSLAPNVNGPDSPNGPSGTRQTTTNNSNRYSAYSDETVSPRMTVVPRLDPFGAHFGSGILEQGDREREYEYGSYRSRSQLNALGTPGYGATGGAGGGGGKMERGLSNASTSTTATEVERILTSRNPTAGTGTGTAGGSPVVTGTGSGRAHVRPSPATAAGVGGGKTKTLQAKVSGYWEGDGLFVSGSPGIGTGSEAHDGDGRMGMRARTSVVETDDESLL